MSGNRVGGLRAARRNKELYGTDFYKKIGSKGGKLGHTGGFAADRELARVAGALGGSRSRRAIRLFDRDIALFLEQTIDMHNGYGYEAFKHGMKRSKVYEQAEMFGVSDSTILRWRRLMRKNSTTQTKRAIVKA
jgi:uncharacterized protein